MEIKVINKTKVMFPVKEKYCEEDIFVTVDIPTYDGTITDDFTRELDDFLTGNVTTYKNDRITELKCGFSYNTSIEELDLPNVITVAHRAFAGATKLKKVNIPNAETLGINAFGSTTVLENALLWNVVSTENQCFQSSGIRVLIAPKLQSVGTQFCNGCSNLEIAVLDSVTTMQGGMGFYNCRALKAVIIKQADVVPPLTTNVFQASSVATGTGYVYVPESLIEQYKVATNWSSIASQIKGLNEIPQDILDELEALGWMLN